MSALAQRAGRRKAGRSIEERVSLMHAIVVFMESSRDDLHLAAEVARGTRTYPVQRTGYWLHELHRLGVVGKKQSRCRMCGKGHSVLWGLMPGSWSRDDLRRALVAQPSGRAQADPSAGQVPRTLRALPGG